MVRSKAPHQAQQLRVACKGTNVRAIQLALRLAFNWGGPGA